MSEKSLAVIDKEGVHFNQREELIGWWNRWSPSGRKLLRVVEGSLMLEEPENGTTNVLLRNIGGFSVDLGMVGFFRPTWTSDEKYVLGDYRGKVIVLELESGRAGTLTAGFHPVAWLPSYRPRVTGDGLSSSLSIRFNGG